MKKYALSLMLLTGVLTTFVSYKYSESTNYRKIKNFSHNIPSDEAPSKLVNQEDFYQNENNKVEGIHSTSQEDEKVKEVQKRIHQKYENLLKKSQTNEVNLELSYKPTTENQHLKTTTTVNKNSTQNKDSYQAETIKSHHIIKDLNKKELVEDQIIVSNNQENTLTKQEKENLSSKKNISELQLIENNHFKTLYPETYAEKQQFIIHNEKENYIIGKNGALIIFPPNAFLNSKGMIENENITIELQEYTKKSEILLSGFFTQSQNSIYESEGIITIKAFKNGEELMINPSKKVLLCLRSENEENSYYLFNQNITNEWQQVADQDKNLIPLPLELLNLHNIFGNTYDKTIIATREFLKRYEYYTQNAPNLKKAITGIYLASIKEPLYKADENVLLYLRDIKADKNLIQQFEKFYQEKLGQVVNFVNIYYSPENSLSNQFEQLGNSKAEAERLAQYFLIRKAYQEWNRNHPNDRKFANKIYKISKLGTFSSMKFIKNIENYSVIHNTKFKELNLSKCTIFFVLSKNLSITKVALDSENNIYIPENFEKGSLMIFDQENNENYLALFEVIENKNSEINITQNIDYHTFNVTDVENHLVSYFR